MNDKGLISSNSKSYNKPRSAIKIQHSPNARKKMRTTVQSINFNKDKSESGFGSGTFLPLSPPAGLNLQIFAGM